MEYIKKEVKKFADERNWLNQPPADVAKSIVIEAAELLEKFQWSNPSIKDIESNQELKQEIIKELADIFIYSAEMAILLDCDINKIVDEKLARNRIKYPADKMKGELGSKNYWKIKKKHRQNKF